jgi:FtsH-binding integral membrane protein
METKLIPLLSISSVLFILLFSILNTAFKDGQFTCNRYILNTYLYVVLAITFIALFLSILRYKDIFLFQHIKTGYSPLMLLLFFGLIGTVLGINWVSPKNVLLKHILWLLFVILITISFHPLHYLYGKAGLDKLINVAFLTTLSLVLALTAFAFYKPELISLSWGPILFFMLLGVIILELIVLLIKGYEPTMLHRAITYIVIGIFMGYLLYDTKMLQIRAKTCTKGTADYIKESLNIFLDIWNLFIRILSLGGRSGK